MPPDKPRDTPPKESQARTIDLPSLQSPERIGNYKILQQIGEGGMGEVFEAEQERPIRRQVALKLIKFGMDTKQVVARFESERQALALMNHPNIARVYDAGATEEGRPYFVMELVRGLPITEYCDKHRLSNRQRLDLFTQVCDGVQHAHQKAIIHRDIKPSNILVKVEDDKPVPKLIDFGIAKATQQRLTEHTLFTEFGQWVGTPEYMSPEQADMSNLDIDTRSDVYSLGAVLYELLVGVQVFDAGRVRAAGLDEIRRLIREDQPSRPSTRASKLGQEKTDIAQARRAEPESLTRYLRGDLDWITMKALEKDRTRRYGSPADLAADIGHHLADEPVAAGPPSALYRMRKFVQRHRAAVAASAAFILLLVAVAITMTVLAGRIATERDRANQEAETARQVSEFLQGLFKVSDPSEARGNTITAREILDRGVEEVSVELADQPLVKARLMATMGNVYRSLGFLDKALELLEGAHELLSSHLPDPHPDLAGSHSGLASILQDRGLLDEAEELFRKSLKMRTELHGRKHLSVARSLNNLALVVADKGDPTEAEALLRQALAMRRELLEPNDPELLGTVSNLANSLKEQSKFEEAERLYRDALPRMEQVHGPDHPIVAAMMNNLAIVLRNTGNLDEAEALLRKTEEINRKLYGDQHPRIAAGLNNLASLLQRKGDLEEAETAYRSSLAQFQTIHGDSHPSVATVMMNLARTLESAGKLEEAEELLRNALSVYRRTVGETHPDIARTLIAMAALERERGDYERALALYEEASTLVKQALGHRHIDVATALVGLGSIHLLSGNPAQAGDPLSEALDIHLEVYQKNHRTTADTKSWLGAQRTRTGAYGEAESLLLESYEVLRTGRGRQARNTKRTLRHLVELYEALEDEQETDRYRSVLRELASH